LNKQSQHSSRSNSHQVEHRRRSIGTKTIVIAIACLIIATGFLLVHVHAATPNLTLPDTVVCPARAGAFATQALTGTSFPGVQGWQVSLSYDSTQVSVNLITLGATWNNINHNTAMNNATGNLAYAYTTLNGATVSGDTTLLSIRWKFLVSPGSTTVHFVLTTENDLATKLLDVNVDPVSYATTDGSLSIYPQTPCPNSPGH